MKDNLELITIDDLYRWRDKKSKLCSQGFAWKSQAVEAKEHNLLEWVGVRSSELTTMKMSIGNEKLFSRVIDGGIIKNWVGIGWVEEGKAKVPGDYGKYPSVIHD